MSLMQTNGDQRFASIVQEALRNIDANTKRIADSLEKISTAYTGE